MSISNLDDIPKLNYDNLVRYLKSAFMPSVTSGMCSDTCRIRPMLVYKGGIVYAIRLLGRTNELCVNCSHYISDYSHSYCVHCAPKDSIEYLYHHSQCHPEIARKFNPKLNYDNLVRYLKSAFMPSVTSGMCSDSCRIRPMLVYKGVIVYAIRLLGRTNILCVNCSHYISDYSHSYCVHCAPENSIEYLYHHSKCKLN